MSKLKKEIRLDPRTSFLDPVLREHFVCKQAKVSCIKINSGNIYF